MHKNKANLRKKEPPWCTLVTTPIMVQINVQTLLYKSAKRKYH